MKNKPTDNIEFGLRNKGYKYIVGVDEAGRGCGALSVVAAAVIIPDGFDTTGINDSKKLSAKKRYIMADRIKSDCIYNISAVDENIIDEINILNATKLAMRQAINGLDITEKESIAIIDGNFTPEFVNMPCKNIINGDAVSISIAAASIIAKTARDGMVLEKHKEYPIYGWDKNKTYLTKKHREALELYGPCVYHRKTFSGVKEYL